GSDAAVIRVKGTQKALAMSTDCNGRHVYLNPFEGTKGAVAEAARNCVCSGAKPVAITNCINFGNPYKPEVYWTFTEAIRGMRDACLAFDTPVTGGNVSFYNENPQTAIYPTPTIGMLGLIQDVEKVVTQEFKDEGDQIILLGKRSNEIGGSEYLKIIHDKITGNPPQVNLEQEKNLHKVFLEIADKNLANSAHDCSDGGLAVALSESCFKQNGKNVGVTINLDYQYRKDFELFGESHSRIIMTAKKENIVEISNICSKNNFNFEIIGEVGGSKIKVNNLINIAVKDLRDIWENTIKL
ncbi:MAG: AIR synthase related protein, partial [Candidatus Cloacimonadota bacterium]|nr:AIR synthase related protein [Candidatus Cloacimonadota bacterium]